ncbi:MAG: hypothetical protein GX357_05335 [Firmicutes bacterium]|nr:hypothetical protein [Bacillota bacterium]
MSTKVGIPRALLYYYYYPGWKAFFQTLGAEVVLSDETTKTILDQGVRAAVEEACLPVKLFLGHVANLCAKAVDYIFIPRVISVERKKYLCPKFLGLPEIARCCLPKLPEILAPAINWGQEEDKTWAELKKLAARFDGRPAMLRCALQAATEAQRSYEARLRQGLTPQEILDGKKAPLPAGKMRVAVLGHAYNLNDHFLSLNILKKLRALGVEVLTAEMLPEEAIATGAKVLPKESFWTFGHKLLGAGNYWLQENKIAGLVLVVSFGCGPDSLICELIERFYKRQQQIPVLLLTLDEHTGEAGIITRLEAFVDMLRWREAK